MATGRTGTFSLLVPERQESNASVARKHAKRACVRACLHACMLRACMHIYMKGRQSPNMFLFGNCRKGTAEPKSIDMYMFGCANCLNV